jgi:hypothetical protein
LDAGSVRSPGRICITSKLPQIDGWRRWKECPSGGQTYAALSRNACVDEVGENQLARRRGDERRRFLPLSLVECRMKCGDGTSLLDSLNDDDGVPNLGAIDVLELR